MTTTTFSRPAANTRSLTANALLPYGLLISIFGVTLLVLIGRGLDLGFVTDVLDYEYHYDRLGTFGGMRWLVVDHWQRHIFAGVFSAPIAYLFPGQSVVWYTYAFFAHFVSGLMVFLLADTILRSKYRPVAMAAALLFAFHTLVVGFNFEFPTGGHRNSALALALLSLWLYLQYVRRGRRNRWWREGSLALFIFAVGTYEQTALFFLLHPVIAYFEDRHNNSIGSSLRWLIRVALDSLWFPVAVAVYLFVLRVLFPPSDNFVFDLERIMRQVIDGFRVVFSPVDLVARVGTAWRGTDLLVTLAVAVLIFVLLFVWMRREPAKNASSSDGRFYLMIVGFLLSVVNIFSVAPVGWSIPDHPRMIYAAAVGFGMLVAGALALLLNRRWGQVMFALVIALLVGSGVTRLFQFQSEYIAANEMRQALLNAVHTAVPAVTEDPPPYFVIMTGTAHPQDDLALFAQDSRFPYTFDLLYNVEGAAADVLFTDLDPDQRPPADLPGSDYTGQFIIAEPEGVYSPLLPYQPIDPQRLIIVEYDHETRSATVLDRLPDHVIANANIVTRSSFDWQTNFDRIIAQDLQD